MEIVSKWNNRYETKRVQPTSFVKHAANDDASFEERQQTAVPHKSPKRFTGQSALVAQIIVSREDENTDIDVSTAQTLAANAGYGAALERKQVRMETGSFLKDAA